LDVRHTDDFHSFTSRWRIEYGATTIGKLASGVKVMKKQHIGSNFDDFLREEHLFDVAQATAVKRVIAFPIAKR
jgi:hypothetical protein